MYSIQYKYMKIQSQRFISIAYFPISTYGAVPSQLPPRFVCPFYFILFVSDTKVDVSKLWRWWCCCCCCWFAYFRIKSDKYSMSFDSFFSAGFIRRAKLWKYKWLNCFFSRSSIFLFGMCAKHFLTNTNNHTVATHTLCFAFLQANCKFNDLLRKW